LCGQHDGDGVERLSPLVQEALGGQFCRYCSETWLSTRAGAS